MDDKDQQIAALKDSLAWVTGELARIRTVRDEHGGGQGSARGAGERITVGQLADKALATLNGSTLRTYRPYIRFLAWGDPSVTGNDGSLFCGLAGRWADEIVPSDLKSVLTLLGERSKAGAAKRAANREERKRVVHDVRGFSAGYNAVGAWRYMFKVAVDDRHLAKGMNPAADLVKPKRSDRRRMALEDEHFEQMVELIGSTGDDPQLDALVLRFIDITGARREGLLNLQVGGIDREECTVRLHEKFDTVFDQPVPDMFVDELLTFAAARGSVARTDPVFVKRTASGGFTPMGRRRYDYIFTDRLQSSFTWADKLQVTAHTLRHHAITRVERRYGRAVAQAFARHAPEGITDIYALANQAEVATAVVGIFGGDHPWRHRPPRLHR